MLFTRISNILFYPIIVSFLLFSSNTEALAHFPHDVIDVVKISKNYANDSTLYIIVRGNLMKSTNGGQTWSRITNGLDHKFDLSTLDLSKTSVNTLYLGTFGDGIYKSVDSGKSWSKVNKGLGTRSIGLISISPHSPDIVLATGKSGGLYKTIDGGRNWKQILPKSDIVSCINYHPEKSHSVVAIGFQSGHISIFHSGELWHRTNAIQRAGHITAVELRKDDSSFCSLYVGSKNDGIYLLSIQNNKEIKLERICKGLTDLSVRSILIDSYNRDSTIVYASTWTNGVFQSTDNGKKWNQISEGLTNHKQADELRQPHYSNLDLTIGPDEDRVMFLSGYNGLYVFNHRNTNWRELNTLSKYTIINISISPNYQTDSTIAITTYGKGTLVSHDKGNNWKFSNQGLKKNSSSLWRLYELEFSNHYESNRTIYLTTRNYLFKSTDDAATWKNIGNINAYSASSQHTAKKIDQNLNGRGKPKMSMTRSFNGDDILFVGTQEGDLFRSMENGSRLSYISHSPHPILFLCASPNFAQDQTLFFSSFGGIYKSVDGGMTFNEADRGIDLRRPHRALNICISPTFATDSSIFAGTPEGLYKTVNGGRSWINVSVANTGNSGFIEAIALSPNYHEDQTIFVTVRGYGLFKSRNGGLNFEAIATDLIEENVTLSHMRKFHPVRMPIQFSPDFSNDQTIYGLSETKLYRTRDGGQTWTQVLDTMKAQTVKWPGK